ncbi:fimbrial protein [Enterobacillus tribolii]|uniref:Major type 1 subunit fimbrin (Pilin)/fimbrial protein n=1 Tax=Enterobacillus tribolii TaxID=1487935 RepID=A0A370R1L9_9GAMM|nr:fimbrial protein [Enterobacillus tribolii]MBW7983076.1 fimbrial protein [Enterobacillus tribolii]RDK95820.1 major type 1 subunit fimbrin (pilin)/fimbrial protein [Enterobacillus tribolii]
MKTGNHGRVMAALMSLFCVPAPALTVHGGSVNFRADVVDAPCSVALESRELQVDLGQVRSNQFGAMGSYSGITPFTLVLENCSASVSTQVGVGFSGVADGKDPLILAAGKGSNAAHGIGIGIFDHRGDLIPINTEAFSPVALQEGENRLQFFARYRSTARQVTAGDASAVASFNLTYQ